MIYVLNYSNIISFVDENNLFILLNKDCKPFCKFDYQKYNLKTSYQIDSKDNNYKGNENLFFRYIIEEINCKGTNKFSYIPQNNIFY